MRKFLQPVCVPLILAMAVLSVVACSKKEHLGKSTSPSVKIIEAVFQPTPVVMELDGRVSSFKTTEIRADIDGIIKECFFEEGREIKIGQKLFELDRTVDQAQLTISRAILAKARVYLNTQLAQYKRYKLLARNKAVSIQLVDNAKLAVKQAEIDVLKAISEEKNAWLKYSNSNIKSPVSGVIGQPEVLPGTYIQGHGVTSLAKIYQIDPISVEFSQSSNGLLAIRQNIIQGELRGAGKGSNEVRLIFEDGSGYPFPGRLEFFTLDTHKNTDIVKVQAVFPNPNGDLLPGMFVRARIIQAINHKAILIPKTAINFDAEGRPKVFLVNASDKVVEASVQLAGISGRNSIVIDGVRPGDRVIISSSKEIKLGQVVKIAVDK